MFRVLFEGGAVVFWLFDPQGGVFVDCTWAVVELWRAGTKKKLLGARREDLSPPLQPGGIPSHEKSIQVVALVEERGSHWFEWVGRRFDGQELPLEITATMIVMGGKKLNLVISRDISERKRAEAALVELNQ